MEKIVEFPLPEREYYVAPRKSRKRRRRPLTMLVLLGTLLFGFLLGKASAAAPGEDISPDGTPVHVLEETGRDPAAGIVPEPLRAGGAQGADETAAAVSGAAASVWGSGEGNPFSENGARKEERTAPVNDVQRENKTAIPAEPVQSAEDWALLVVNWENPLPENFQIPELTQLRNGHAIDSRAYPSLQAMMDAARAEGLAPLICSSYRTWDKQEELFARKTQYYLDQGCTQMEAEERAAQWVARPGTSEHQVGLAVDIVDTSYQLLDEAQEETAVQKWLMAHCAEYGFILRYPTEKSALTGVNYEPWHYRYVGEAAAREIMEQGICLEEYIA
ncbi:D-alanyl-D-alanine carboxypeptidase family protein [uncultured Dysosmobacter sp.]|uniref:M15 family metallopeptidase n=1 Tax=uncultured Dysosmobacter sp. TaxID=2591384 RepID=UPI00261DFB0A|nr:M15 family metallopeptidase [uncultured Dysosmobacter sp.]